MVRTYVGSSQSAAAALYGEDALRLADDGWIAASQSWVAGEWPLSAYLAAGLLVLIGIGILLLIVMAFIKPTRTLMVTYQRSAATADTQAPAS